MAEFQLSKALTPETLELDQQTFDNKDELFSHMTSMFFRADKIGDEQAFLKALYEREETGSTFMDNFIAIPHGKSSTVKEASIAFCRAKQPFRYESCGETGVARLVFMLAIPDATGNDEYIKILATLSRLLVYEEFVDKLMAARDYQSVIDAATWAESKRHD